MKILMHIFLESNLFKGVFVAFVCLSFAWPIDLALAYETIHPTNKKLMMMGMMKKPEYFPDIPRLPVTVAKNYYDTNKATFVLISHSSKDLIVGGRHLTEDLPPVIDPNKLLLRKDHILAVYCP